MHDMRKIQNEGESNHGGNIIAHSRKWQELELQIWQVTSGVLQAYATISQSSVQPTSSNRSSMVRTQSSASRGSAVSMKVGGVCFLNSTNVERALPFPAGWRLTA